jgi:hypothetical protein
MPPPLPNLPPELAPTNYFHVKERDHTVKQKILLDLSIPRPHASTVAAPVDEDSPHLILDSHNGGVQGEVWLLSANREDAASHEDSKSSRERVHLHFRSHNGAVKAQVHLHPRTVEPRPFLNVEVGAHNGAITVTIPRSFRGQMTLQTKNGWVKLSPMLAPRAASLSVLDGTHTYFVGERPSCGKWHTGESEDGDEVDGLIASSKNGSIRVSYDDENASYTKGPRVLSSLFKAMGF